MGWPGPMTCHQMRAWQAWLALEWNRPSRSDFYVMTVAAEVRRGHVKKPKSVKLQHFELEFKRKSGRANKPAPDQQMELSKARWGAVVDGLKKRQDREERREPLRETPKVEQRTMLGAKLEE